LGEKLTVKKVVGKRCCVAINYSEVIFLATATKTRPPTANNKSNKKTATNVGEGETLLFVGSLEGDLNANMACHVF
jgi:hypothetical protein